MRILIIGATSAIATAAAHQFAARGDELFLIGRNKERLQALTQDLNIRTQREFNCAPLDLNQIEHHAKVLNEAKAALGQIDVVLIAHGVLPQQHKCENSVHETLEVFKTNCLSVISLLTLVSQKFIAQKKGCIAVISSVAGDRGRKSNYVYGATKGGLNIFLQGLRSRLKKHNVHVLTIKPGFVDSPMTRHMKKGLLWVQPQKIAQLILQGIDKQKDVIYTPGFWRYIMWGIKLIPEKVFKALAF